MSYVRNIWYVAAWSHEVENGKLTGGMVAGEPIVLFRQSSGNLVAMEDRCPHRHAPLSLGRLEGDDVRCMYHGLRLGGDGGCKEVPGSTKVPPRLQARTFPVFEKWSWIWVWLGDPRKADPALIPDCYGLDNPKYTMRASALDYAADYQLINDNLCDLSHVDFTHENTFGWGLQRQWSNKEPKIVKLDNGIRVERWFHNVPLGDGDANRLGEWFSSYQFLLPGIFLMRSASFENGTATSCNYETPLQTPVFEWVEQQAVTPRHPKETRYFYATGQTAGVAAEALEEFFGLAKSAFDEDKRMIEGQQAIWDLTPSSRHMGFIPQDKAPAMFRKLLAECIAAENQEETATLSKSA